MVLSLPNIVALLMFAGIYYSLILCPLNHKYYKYIPADTLQNDTAYVISPGNAPERNQAQILIPENTLVFLSLQNASI